MFASVASRARAAAVAALAVTCAACVTPAQRVDRTAAAHGFVRDVVTGRNFDHLVYRNGVIGADGPLHVYIEGDGSPYLDTATIARDPTPRMPVMLNLMALDRAPAVYVGRPCYFSIQSISDCSPVYWTVGRFSDEVVASMAAVIERERRARSSDAIVLLGHSGGGALAVLLAQRLANVQAVVTVAGNLNVAEWARLHGYSPLDESLNPIDAPLTGVGTVLHLAGGADEVVPAGLVTSAALRIGGEVRVVPDARHTCCWDPVWPSVLDGLP